MNKGDLIEALAAIEHRRWGAWQKWMHDQGTRNADGSLTLPADLVARWDRQIATGYPDLSEREKESDREQVMRYWPLIEPLFELAESADAIEWPVIVTLPRRVYDYLAETYDDDPDVSTTIRDICVSMRNADAERPER